MASVTLTWTAASPAPANGYRIKYWPTDTPATISTVSPNPIASPYTITGLTDNTNYSGTIEASCEGSAYSTAVSWSITVAPTNYYYQGLLCGGSIVNNFYSTESNLVDSGLIVKALCSACGSTVQCFDNITTSTVQTSNPVISTHSDCTTCSTAMSMSIYLDLAGGARAQATGQAVLYTSPDGTNYSVASSVLNTQGASQSITVVPGNWYYLQVTKTGCTGESCGAVRAQAAWTIDGQTYGPNVGAIPNGSSTTSDPFQIATSGSHVYSFNAYVDFLI